MRRIGKFFRLNRKEKEIFLQAVFLLTSSRLSLHFKEFNEVVNHYGKQVGQQHSVENNIISPARIVALLEAGGKLIPFTTCLSKSLAGSVLMRKYGYTPVLHIGVAKENVNVLEAHAWLSLNDKIIVGNCHDLERYRELPFLFNESI